MGIAANNGIMSTMIQVEQNADRGFQSASKHEVMNKKQAVETESRQPVPGICPKPDCSLIR